MLAPVPGRSASGMVATAVIAVWSISRTVDQIACSQVFLFYSPIGATVEEDGAVNVGRSTLPTLTRIFAANNASLFQAGTSSDCPRGESVLSAGHLRFCREFVGLTELSDESGT
jgi:hypothetical protein